MTLRRMGSGAGGAGLALLAAGGVLSVALPVPPGWLLALPLAGAALLLFAAYVHLDAIAARLARRQTKYGLNVLAMVVLLLVIIVLVEVFAQRYNGRLDLTEGRRYSLSPQTVQALKDLRRPVKAVAFFLPEERRAAEDLLRQYADLSSRFRYAFVDPDRDPGMARRYKITLYGTVVLETPEEGAAPASEGAPAAQARAEAAAKKGAGTKGAPAAAVAERPMREEQITDLSEERLTNALVKITRPGRRTIYFLQGHGEGSLADAGRAGFGLLRQEVEKANYVVKDLLLPRDRAVPGDAAALVILRPERDVAEAELALLEAYLGRGGKLLVLADPFTAPGLRPFLARYGIRLGDDVVVDRAQHMLGGDLLTPVVSRYADHPITRALAGSATVFQYARSVDVAEKLPQGVAAEKLAETSAFPGSWAETDLRAEMSRGQIGYHEGRDRKGPVPLAAVATIEPKPPAGGPAKAGDAAGAAGATKAPEAEGRRPPRARLVVYGGATFANNTFLAVGAVANRDLVLNTISWLAEEEDLLAIRPKDPKSAPLFLTEAQGRLFFWIPVVLMPLAVAGAGVGVFVRRRRGR